MARNRDRKAGRSKVFHYRHNESWQERHARRLATAYRFRSQLEAWCAMVGLKLNVNRDVWRLRKPGFVATWWPSTAKLVFNGHFTGSLHVHDYVQLIDQVRKELKKFEPVLMTKGQAAMQSTDAEIDALFADSPTAPTLPSSPQATASAASEEAADEAPHLTMPDGEMVDMTDADALITAYERIEKMDATVYAVKTQIKQALAAMTEGDKKTRRVAGKSRVAVVTMPSGSWNNSKLKEAYNSYPQFRDQYLRIESVAVKAVEFNKTRSMAIVDNAPLETFVGMVAAAEQPPSGNPSVKIEK